MIQPSFNAPEQEGAHSSEIEASVIPMRAIWGVVGLVVLTVGSLGLAWLFPDATLLHFLWVAHAVPLIYLLLVWWGTQPSKASDDAP